LYLLTSVGKTVSGHTSFLADVQLPLKHRDVDRTKMLTAVQKRGGGGCSNVLLVTEEQVLSVSTPDKGGRKRRRPDFLAATNSPPAKRIIAVIPEMASSQESELELLQKELAKMREEKVLLEKALEKAKNAPPVLTAATLHMDGWKEKTKLLTGFPNARCFDRFYSFLNHNGMLEAAYLTPQLPPRMEAEAAEVAESELKVRQERQRAKHPQRVRWPADRSTSGSSTAPRSITAPSSATARSSSNGSDSSDSDSESDADEQGDDEDEDEGESNAQGARPPRPHRAAHDAPKQGGIEYVAEYCPFWGS
jgi:hypothetical protein